MQILLPQNLEYYRKANKLTQEQAATVLNLKRTTYVNYEKGFNEPDLKTLLLISSNLGVTLEDLLTADLSKGKGTDLTQVVELPEKGKVKGKAIGKAMGFRESSVDYRRTSFSPKVITVDQSGEENILFVPAKARAGYLTGFGDPEYLQTLPSFRLPGLTNATYRMFEASGPSMAPTIGDGDSVIASYTESLDDIIDGRVYVVVTDEGIVVKRLLNRISQRGKIVFKSDTIAHRSEYRTYEMDFDRIRELWYCRMKLSADFSAPSEVYHRLNDLESDVSEMKQINTSLLFQMDEIRQIIKGEAKE